MLPHTVVFCPSEPGSPAPPWREPARLCAQAGVRVVEPVLPEDEGPAADTPAARKAHWVATCAIAIATSGGHAPILLVAHGPTGVMLPALGFAQRAARRGLHGYVFVDALIPDPETGGGDWPDAPVTYIASPDAPPDAVLQAELRGWRIVRIERADLAQAFEDLLSTD